MTLRAFLRPLVLALFVAPCLSPCRECAAQQGAVKGEWRHYAADSGSTKYSSLDQITRNNAGKLKVVWTWDSPDKALQAEKQGLSTYPYENTPLMVGGTLYASTSLGLAAAIDAASGETKWVCDTGGYANGRPGNLGFVHRGLTYWSNGAEERLYIATPNAYLCAINAKTGKLVSEFGEEGKVDLAKAIPLASRSRNYSMSSPPVICKNVIVVGSSINDGPQTKEYPRGDIQAFDVRTGKPAWIFHTIPQEGEFGNETWESDAWKYTGNANCWTCFSADEELGYLYIPTGTPTNDWYGGHRPGDNLFAESLVCLDATSGKRVWHFQTVHHGLWDYDIPAAPVLCNLNAVDRQVKAVVQITKVGFAWVFDRTNGEPLWPIEERPVAQSKVPGEQTSPTQPFPSRPEPFERQGTEEHNLVDFTPEIRDEAKELLNKLTHGPLFTPPSEQGTINLPGWTGGANWWGASFDPETGMFYIPSVTSPIVVKLTRPDGARSNFEFIRGGGGSAAGPRGLPLFKGPYGRITAYDLNTGDLAWQIPHGDGQRKKFSEIVGFDVGPQGGGSGAGPLLTKTLLFVGQGTGGSGPRNGYCPPVLRAYDKSTGAVLAEVPLPATPSGTPMTYMVGGKQHIVLATIDNKFVALALP